MNYRLVSKILLSVFTVTMVETKVTIFARYFGQPEFIKYQNDFFKKNLQDEYEFIVIEESNNVISAAEIRDECKRNGVTCIHIPRSEFECPKLTIKDTYVALSSPSFECCVSIQYIYDQYVASCKNTCLILDNDIFLISPFSIEKYLGSASFAYVNQEKGVFPNSTSYMLANFLILNPLRMPEKERLDFNMGTILGNNTDSGGYTYFYLRDYKDLGRTIPIKNLHETNSLLKEQFIDRCPQLFTSEKWRSHYFIDKEVFLHIRMGSNWSGDRDYNKVMDEVIFLFDQLLYKPS